MAADGDSIPGKHAFIEEAEYRCFRDLVADHYRGSGLIVDAGCFAGASTHALCSGIPKRILRGLRGRKLVAIDRFVAADRYVAENFAEAGVDIRFGESFLSVFLENLRDYIGIIDVRAGDLIQVGRIEDEIEVLVIDVAKSAALNAFIVGQWFGRLTAGRSIVVQQDFYAPTQPWIAVSMGALLDYFSVVHEKVGESAVFRLEKPIPEAKLLEAVRLNWRTPQGLAEIDKLLSRMSVANRGPTLLMKALVLHNLGRTPEARRLLESLVTQHPQPTDAKWEKWLGMAVAALDPGAFSKERILANVYLKDAALRMGY